MLVDHFINFKGCTQEEHTRNMRKSHPSMSMEEFVNERRDIMQEYPTIWNPDFAQDERLPADARIYDDELEDQWEKNLYI